MTYILFAIVLFIYKSSPKTDEVGPQAVCMVDESVSFQTHRLGMKHVQIEKQFTILDVGCGGGRAVQKLATMAAEGNVYGVDYAKGSVAAARGKNDCAAGEV